LRFEPLEQRRPLSVTVNTLGDEADGSIVDGDVSLRDAIALAAPGETIDFAVTGVIGLTSLGHLTINKDLTINGPGSALLTIRAYDPTPDTINADGSRVFRIDDTNSGTRVNVRLLGLMLTGGDRSDVQGGGAILSRGNLTILSSTITGNHLTGSAGGGIAHYSGDLMIASSTISNNSTPADGGGVYSLTIGNVTIIDSAIHGNNAGNHGGGIHIQGAAAATIAGTTISGNLASDNGAGVQLQDNTTSILNNVTITGNNAGRVGGGIQVLRGAANIANSTISGNSAGSSGGGLVASAYTMVVSHSTISGNLAGARGGGLYQNYGDTTILNSTLSLNQASSDGGGVFSRTNAGDSLVIQHATLTRNTSDSDTNGTGSGGGIYLRSNSGVGAVAIEHTIIAGNIDRSNQAPDINNTAATTPATLNQAFTLVGNNKGSGLASSALIGTELAPIDPLLGPLAASGGPTLTHALLAGSPAIDAGDPSFSRPLTYDQRGAPFLRVQNGRIDIGAVELNPSDSALPGDYDRNGVVDRGDYDVWKSAFGLHLAPGEGADGSGNGVIDVADYVIWRRNYVVQPNRPPVAVGDVFHVIQNSFSNVLTVLANDLDPDPGPPLVIDEFGPTDAGSTIAVVGDGQIFLYTPPTGFLGTDRFTYTVTDRNGGTAQTMVTVQVIQAPPALTAHLHANLSIFINGDQQPHPPAHIGRLQTAELLSPIHTEAADGRLHIEPSQSGPPTEPVTVDDFFTTWRTNAGSAGNNPNAIFTANQVLDHVVAADEVVHMYVNGLPVMALGNYIIRNEDEIVIAVEKKSAAANAPIVVPIADQTVLAGSPLHIPLRGFDPNSTSLTFTATSSNKSVVSTEMAAANRSLLVNVADYGQMTFELFEDQVPGITQNIIALVQSGILDETLFHRVIPGFVAQGFDPTGTGAGHPGLLNFDDQYDPDLQHNSSGLISMAKTGDDTNSSQIFITDLVSTNSNSISSLRAQDFNHSVFGGLTFGENVRRLIMQAPIGTMDRPMPDVVIDDVEIVQIDDKAVLRLKASQGVTGEADITLTARDAQGNEFTQSFHVTVQPDPFNSAPFLLSTPQNVQTTVNTPVNVQLPAFDVENDPTILLADQTGLEETILFDNTGGESGVTPPGTTTFSYLGANFSGGTVTATGMSPLAASGSTAYVFGAGGGQATFDFPLNIARFYFVHEAGQTPFSATAFDAAGNILSRVMSNAADEYNDPDNFVALGSFGPAIDRIEFSGGHVDNFFFQALPVPLTFQIDQDNDVITITPPAGFVGTMAIRVGVRQATFIPPHTIDQIDAQVIRITVLPAGAIAAVEPTNEDDDTDYSDAALEAAFDELGADLQLFGVIF
jgi:cyclophilin family peptidyl-prolyl cis-trans isomerase